MKDRTIEGGYLLDANKNRVMLNDVPGAVAYGNASKTGGDTVTANTNADWASREMTPEQMKTALAASATARFNGMNGQYDNWQNPYTDVYALANQQGGGIASPDTTPVKTDTASLQSGLTATPSGLYTASIITPDGQQGTGYIINGKTYLDPEGTQRVDAGTQVTTRDGRTFTYGGEPAALASGLSDSTTPEIGGTDAMAQFNQMMNSIAMPDSAQYQAPDYNTFMAQAMSNLTPVYDQMTKESLAAVDTDAAKRGFFGQTPWVGMREDAALKVGAAKAEQAATMASQLYGMSVDQAKAALNDAWQRYNAKYSGMQDAYNATIAAQNAQKDDAYKQQQLQIDQFNADTNRNYKTDYMNNYLVPNVDLKSQQTQYNINKPYPTKSTKGKTTSTDKKTTVSNAKSYLLD
jgi:hypothetical protein